jgi:hypothetical protein
MTARRAKRENGGLGLDNTQERRISYEDQSEARTGESGGYSPGTADLLPPYSLASSIRW